MLRAVSPAPPSAVLEVAPATRSGRGAVLIQALRFPSIAVYAGEDLLAVAMLIDVPQEGRVELCVGLRPAAARRMLALVRAAHSTLAEIADTGVVVTATVSPRNRAGRRMASAAGFAADDGTKRMTWRG